MTITANTPASSYLEELKKKSGNYIPPKITNSTGVIQSGINRMPVLAGFENPNEHFTNQRYLLDGGTPVSGTSRTNYKGIQEREMLAAETGDIATDIEQQKLNQRKSQADSMLDSFSGGFDSEFGGAGDGSGFDGEQLSNARLIADEGRRRGFGQGEIQIALMTALAESGLKNVAHGDRDSVGLFQQRTSQGWGSVQQIMDPRYSAGKFYEALGTSARGANPWNTAQNVQRSAFADGSNYRDQYQRAISAYNAISGNSARSQPTYIKDANLNNWIQRANDKYIDYDGYYGAQCVDLYNAYTAGFVGGKNFMVGYAPEIFNNYDRNAYSRFDRNQGSGMPGDVAVFRPGGYTPVGHVAVVVGDNGNGTLRVLQSNATAAGSAGNSIISNISKSTLMGYLRPNKLMGRR